MKYGILVTYHDPDGDIVEVPPSLESLGVYAITEFSRLRDAERAAKALRLTRPSRRYKYHVVELLGVDSN
jgi:hypothetical protein